MKTINVIPLVELNIGSHFQFGYHALRDDQDDRIPRWRITKVGNDFCEVRPENLPKAIANAGFPVAARLPKLMVRPLSALRL